MDTPGESNTTEKPPQTTTTLCHGGCGFYGSGATEGLCSKCFKEKINSSQQQQQQQQPQQPQKQDGGSVGSPSSSSASTMAASTSSTSSNTTINTITNNNQHHHTRQLPPNTTLTSPASAPTIIQPSTPINIPPNNRNECGLEAAGGSFCSLDSKKEEMGGVGGGGGGGGMESPCSSQSSLGTSPSPLKKKNRCHQCKKKVGLTGFECRCGGMFCGIHRYSDMHECSFDYKSLGQDEIRKANPVVQANKIDKI